MADHLTPTVSDRGFSHLVADTLAALNAYIGIPASGAARVDNAVIVQGLAELGWISRPVATPVPADDEAAVVAEFCREYGQYITAINNCPSDNDDDYYVWQGHAEARRQLLREQIKTLRWLHAEALWQRDQAYVHLKEYNDAYIRATTKALRADDLEAEVVRQRARVADLEGQPARARVEWAVQQSGNLITPFEDEETARHMVVAMRHPLKAEVVCRSITDWHVPDVDTQPTEPPRDPQPVNTDLLGRLHRVTSREPADAIGVLYPDMADEGEHVPADQPTPQDDTPSDLWIGDECEVRIGVAWREGDIIGARRGDDGVLELHVDTEFGTCWVFPHQLRRPGTMVTVELPDNKEGDHD